MSETIQLLILGLEIFLVLAFGWWLFRRPAAGSGIAEAQLQTLLGRLQSLSADVAGHVGEHADEMVRLNDELDALQHEEAGPQRTNDEQQVIEQIMLANKTLHEQLAASERRIQEHMQTIGSLKNEARVDPLTGLANRRAVDEELSRRHSAWKRHGEALSVLMIDVDHFKKFNDTHGHQAGDEVLRQVGQILRKAVRDTDVAARYGGEEFIVVMPSANLEAAARAAERIRTAVETAVVSFQGLELRLTISLGAAEVRPGEDAVTLVEHADTALYASKQSGRNRVSCYDPAGCRTGEGTPVAVAEASPAAPEAAPEAAAVAAGPAAEAAGAKSAAPRTGPELRAHPRQILMKREFIAPYQNKRFPEADEFFEVQCFDISVGGISFFLPHPPEYQHYLLALGRGAKPIYTIVQVARVALTKMHTIPVYLVGCRFTSRVQPPDEHSPQPPALATGKA